MKIDNVKVENNYFWVTKKHMTLNGKMVDKGVPVEVIKMKTAMQSMFGAAMKIKPKYMVRVQGETNGSYLTRGQVKLLLEPGRYVKPLTPLTGSIAFLTLTILAAKVAEEIRESIKEEQKAADDYYGEWNGGGKLTNWNDKMKGPKGDAPNE